MTTPPDPPPTDADMRLAEGLYQMLIGPSFMDYDPDLKNSLADVRSLASLLARVRREERERCAKVVAALGREDTLQDEGESCVACEGGCGILLSPKERMCVQCLLGARILDRNAIADLSSRLSEIAEVDFDAPHIESWKHAARAMKDRAREALGLKALGHAPPLNPPQE